MNKADLKKLIKPLVKECVNEMLIEEGLLSNVVSEVAKGLQGNILTEAKPAAKRERKDKTNDFQMKRTNAEISKKIEGHRKKMMEAVGGDAYNGVNLFEGTTPMNSQASSDAQAGSVDLGDASSSGVDISSLVGTASEIWKAMK